MVSIFLSEWWNQFGLFPQIFSFHFFAVPLSLQSLDLQRCPGQCLNYCIVAEHSGPWSLWVGLALCSPIDLQVSVDLSSQTFVSLYSCLQGQLYLWIYVEEFL